MHKAIVCNEDNLQIKPCYCMYYDQTLNLTVVGNCMVSCYAVTHVYYQTVTRYSVQNASLFNHDMCGIQFDTHREGRFCGRCKEGFGLAVYSYHYTSCIPCTDYGYKNWLRYFAVALLPLTLFYFLVVLLRINVPSSHLNGIMFVIQCTLSPLQLRMIDGLISAESIGGTHEVAVTLGNTLLGLLGIFNMDFFRASYPYFCLHPGMNILHVASLDFIVALYPFFLILLTYLLINMHDRNCRLVVLAWKPLKWCLGCYRREVNPHASLAETFGTFILFSNVKILGVCFDLLAPTKAYAPTGTQLDRQFLYYDASIEYFSSEHLPFAVLALLIGFIFVVLPFLLLVAYPCSCFQRCLNFLGWRNPSLHIFMDAFQGSYRTEPRDLRYFSAYYLLLRFLVLLSINIVGSVFAVPVIAYVVTAATFVLVMFQPYKSNLHNKLDIASLISMVLLYVGMSSSIVTSYLDEKWITCSKVLLSLSLTLVFLLVVALLCLRMFHKLYLALLRMWRYITQKNSRNASQIIEYFDQEDTRSSPGHYPSLLGRNP